MGQKAGLYFPRWEVQVSNLLKNSQTPSQVQKKWWESASIPLLTPFEFQPLCLFGQSASPLDLLPTPMVLLCDYQRGATWGVQGKCEEGIEQGRKESGREMEGRDGSCYTDSYFCFHHLCLISLNPCRKSES